MTEPELKTLMDTVDEPNICSVCGYVYRVELLKEGDDWNDFGYRFCPFCGHMTDPYA